MNDIPNSPNSTAPKWFAIMAIALTIWNLMGVMAFIIQMTMTAEQIAALPETERQLYQDIPIWVNIAFAFAVFGGTLGCIALVLKKAISLPILVISLIGVLVQMFHAFFIANSFEVYGPSATVMPIIVIIVALYLVWQANNAKTKHWLA